MDQEHSMRKVAELQKLFPNQKIHPSFLHVYGKTVATLPFSVSFDVTEVRKPVMVEALKSLIHQLQCAIDDMPEDKDVLDKTQGSSSGPDGGDSV